MPFFVKKIPGSKKDRLTRFIDWDDKRLKCIRIPTTVSVVGKNAFRDYQWVKKLIIPRGIRLIEHRAFYNCSNLEIVSINTSLTKIEGEAFENTPWLKNEREQHDLIEINKVIIDGKMYNSKDLIIPRKIKTISSWAFRCNHIINSVIITSVETIGEGAFYQCENLKCLALKNGVAAIGDFAFANCPLNNVLVIPPSVRYIGKGAFYNTNIKIVAMLSKDCMFENAFESDIIIKGYYAR